MAQPTDQGIELFTHPLTYVRAEKGWSLRDLVEAIASSAKQLGVNMAAGREKAWRWEKRNVVPDMPTQRALAHALKVPAEQLELLPWPRWLPAGDAVLSSYPWTVAGCIQALDAVEDALLDRRGFLTICGATLTAVAYGWAAHEPDRVVHAMRGGRLDAETVAWAEDRIPGLRRMDDRLSGPNLLRMIDADLHMVTELITTSSCPADLRRRLFRTAAELGQLAGWVAFDTGRHSAAQRYYIAGLHAAHAADDRTLASNALAGLSFQAALCGDPQNGVSLADTAHEQANRGSARVRALMASRQARAHARADDPLACGQALLRAERYLDIAENGGDDDPPWVYYFDRAELNAQAGACFVDLHQPQRAEPLLANALAAQDPSYVRDRTIYLVRAARTQMQFRHLDAACDLAGQAAELAHASYSGRSMAAVKGFRAELQPYADSSHVVALDAQLTELAA